MLDLKAPYDILIRKGKDTNPMMLSRPTVWLSLALILAIVPAVRAEEAVVTPPAAPQAAADQGLPDIENLDFASGEVVSFDAASGALSVKIYLDSAGNANEQTLALSVDQSTEITNGETDLKSDSLVPAAEVDVEYDVRTKKATYIFIY